jgi:glycosidase
VNYVRSHDDIGWTFDDDDARSLGIDPQGHRAFLNSFFIGTFPGSFSRGLPFQENKLTGDARVSGTSASLAGLEKGIVSQDPDEIEYAARKIQLLYGLAFTLGGIPLIYLGDELGMCNDYSFLEKRGKAHDSRWVHRVRFSPEAYERRHEEKAIEHIVYEKIQQLVRARTSSPMFAVGEYNVHFAADAHLFVCDRILYDQRVIICANFSDTPSVITTDDHILDHEKTYKDMLSGRLITQEAELQAWEFMLLEELSYER